MNFHHFLLNKETDFKGRFLSDIWEYSDNKIESQHDFIQLLFPLNKPSRSVLHGYYLNEKNLIDQIRNDQSAKENLIKSKDWFVGFLSRNNQWKNYSDHNQLRITRVIECLRLLVSAKEADLFYKKIITMLGSDHKVNKKTLEFWSNA